MSNNSNNNANTITDNFGVVYSADGKRLLKCLNEDLQEYTVREGTENVCECAFAKCDKLRQVHYPESVSNKSFCEFDSCWYKDFTIDKNDTNYKTDILGAVYSADRKRLIRCPKNLRVYVAINGTEVIGEGAFINCEKLEQVCFPDSVTTVENCAFAFCNNLKSVKFSKSPTKVLNPLSVFKECRKLEEIIVKDGSSVDGVLFAHNMMHLSRYPLGKPDKRYVIPDTVVSIGPAFYDCKNLEDVVIPDSVELIEILAFAGCSELRSVTIGKSVKVIDSNAFSGCTKLTSVTIPKSVKYMGNNVFAGCDNLTIYCEAKSQPKKWEEDWNRDNIPVVWGAKKQPTNILSISKPANKSTMTIKNFLESGPIQKIEREIIHAYNQRPLFLRPHASGGKHLLEARKIIINDFVLQHQAELMPDIIAFNDALREALRRTYQRTKEVYDVCKALGDVHVTAECYMDGYPPLHPVQNEDREALWEVLTDNSWNPEYNLLIHNGEKFGDLIGGEDDNWNEHLDPQLTADLHLIMQFHTLWEHTGFAITDLIYCRDFNSEFEIDYSEYNILSGK
ncbi:MAG: leucine-rich repeat protein [Salinivirgaceae bacterium]|nr:leucine-rich repeat protein [Salinivirgaceae bacterium]